MVQRGLAAGGIALLGILLAVGAGATGPPEFPEGETVEQNLTMDYVVSPDGYYEDFDLQYYAVKTATVKVPENIDDDADDQAFEANSEILNEDEWQVFTSNDTTTEWSGSSTVQNALDRQDEKDTVRVQYNKDFNEAFSETGRYAYVMILGKIDGTYDGDQWSYNITEVDRKFYLFEIDQDDLSFLP